MLNEIYDGIEPIHPVFIALEPVIHSKRLEKELFVKLLDAFRRDQVQKRYDTWDDLRGYTSGSADPIGRLVLRLHGYRDHSFDQLSDSICTGLQLVNFLQDIKSDYLKRDRIYLPLEDIEKYGVSEKMISRVPSPLALQKLVAFESERAERLLSLGKTLIDKVKPLLERQLILFHGGGRLALDSIRRAQYDTNSRQRNVKILSKFALFMRAFQGKSI